jgi:hypothetical protein
VQAVEAAHGAGLLDNLKNSTLHFVDNFQAGDLNATPRLDVADLRQVLQVVDSFIERWQFQRAAGSWA